MRKRARSTAIARATRLAALAGAVMATAACAAVLGIDDRELIGSTTSADGGDSSSGDGSKDGSAIDAAVEGSPGDGEVGDAAGKVCVPAECGPAGGSCKDNVCTFACTGTSCNSQTILCPAGNDCAIDCSVTNSCDTVKCKGGRSCTLLCTGSMTCKNGVSCESERCDFECIGESCKTAAPITCDAGVCIANCAGDKSCDKGVDFRATEFCGITCSGSPSCSAGGAPVRCFAPDASITCTDVANTCQTGKPQCFTGPNGYCSVTCGNAVSSCGADYCCDSGTGTGTCQYNSNLLRPNTCP